MWSFKKILVPTDFSPHAGVALDAAIDLAKKFDAELVLVHAYQLPVYVYPTTPAIPILELTQQIQSSAGQALFDLASESRKRGVPVTTELVEGAPWEAILDVAKKRSAELIVIGSRGLRGLPRVLLGSTAERVVRYAMMPVLTFHAPATPDERDDLLRA